MSKQPPETKPEQRRDVITAYLREHPGSTKAQMTRELDGTASKKTIDKYVGEMIKNNEIEAKKKRK